MTRKIGMAKKYQPKSMTTGLILDGHQESMLAKESMLERGGSIENEV